MNSKTKTPRPYRKTTRAEVVEFKVKRALYGNGTAAVRDMHSTMISPKDRAYRLAKKADDQNTLGFIDEQMDKIGVDAINRIGKLVNSSDERVATKNSHYIVDHLKGQATKKSITLHGRTNIQDVLA